MNKITRRKSPKFGSSKGKLNPFQDRGMEKFQEVYSELEKLRATIAAEEGVSTSDVWFTRGTSEGREWVPVVVGKVRHSSSIPSREDSYSLTRLEQISSDTESKNGDEAVLSDPLPTAAEESQSLKKFNKPSWLSVRFEQTICELQHGARKALKAVTLFIMVVAAVIDVLVAIVAGFTSSLIAKYLRPLWARYLPVDFSQQHNKDLCFAFPVAMCSWSPICPSSVTSAPTSPRQSSLCPDGSVSRSKSLPASTPASPVRSCSTFFSADRPKETGSPVHRQSEEQTGSPVHRRRQQQSNHAEDQSGSPSHRRRQQQNNHSEDQTGSPSHRRSDRRNHRFQQEFETSSSDGGGGGATEVMLIVAVILLSLSSFGLLSAIVLASSAWFVFPIARKLRHKTPTRTAPQYDLRKGSSI